MKNKLLDKTNNHHKILTEIQTFFSMNDVEKDVQKQIDNFYNDPTYKSYNGARTDKRYSNWQAEVIKRFGNQCCVCYSTDKLVSHHLYSYKYYSALRTEINNGVCICNTCHEIFNDLYSNVNTLEQFLQYRKKFKGKSHTDVKKQIQSIKSTLISGVINKSSKRISKSTTAKISHEVKLRQNKIVSSFEELRNKIADQWKTLQKQYGWEKGIQIDFRDKQTTSLAVINKLQMEMARINTLISCNKICDKTIMASKFHMSLNEFSKKLENPKEYLNFTPSEITHLNNILRDDYTKEYNAIRSDN